MYNEISESVLIEDFTVLVWSISICIKNYLQPVTFEIIHEYSIETQTTEL